MTTRQAVDDFLQQCENVLDFAKEQYSEGSKQEHYNIGDYTESMQQLESACFDLAKMAQNANDQQREQLNRMRMRLEQFQHDMVTKRP